MNGTQVWREHADLLARAMRIGRQLVEQGKGNLYQIGHTFFEAAFGAYLARPEGGEWRPQLDEALSLFVRAVERDDCRLWPEYPFNQAHLHLETYLGQWWAGQEAEAFQLDRSINLNVEGLFDGQAHPQSSYAAMPPGYLLRGDAEHLATFWQLMEEQGGLERLPAELALWRRWSVAFLEGQRTPDAFWAAYAADTRRRKSPTDRPARFYLAAAKIALEQFAVAAPPADVLRRLAVEPWRKG
ncbi:hypothetical protein [Promineifilum sp.]|uniref:hypothetical protein n=1 Tax=Promineifilum sp. TaxID=2664178 RepID=UPI0035AFC51F